MKIVLVSGDGIGPEIVDATVSVLDALAVRFGLELTYEEAYCGLEGLRRYGMTVRGEDIELAKSADGVILGPMSVKEYPPEHDGGLNVPAAFRSQLELYANVRPCYTRPNLPATAKSMDLVFVRENLEDFYTDRNMYRGNAELLVTEDVAIAIGRITRHSSERIARTAFELARRRQRRVTIVHKAPVLRMYSRLFLDSALSVAKDYPDVTANDIMIDAAAALLVRTPEAFDVVLTTNMFGDILSDEAAELAGSLGLAASLNHGDKHAVAQAGHGSAPDIAGRNIANPVSMMLSVAMLLDHLGFKHSDERYTEAGLLLSKGVDAEISSPDGRTRDLGGSVGTKEFATRVTERIGRE